MRPIDADALVAGLEESYKELRKLYDSTKDDAGAKDIYQGELITFLEAILRTRNAPTLDYAPVVRCKDCAYYKKAHVLLNDGTERDYRPEDFTHDPFCIGVTADIGINVGGMCKRDTGYDEDKSVFRQPDDFCSRGARMDGKEHDNG